MAKADKQFKFSIIMSVYQVAEYIDEAILSILAQDIGFEENVQLILVDDGSTDGSGRICDDYGACYPENIKVLHKANGGLSSARNAGLPYAKGEYVNFFDPDDVLSDNVLSEVLHFYEKNQEIGVVSIPLCFFEGMEKEHPLNLKCSKGSRIVDLMTEWSSVHISVASSFIRADIAKNLCFDEKMSSYEDAKELIKIFLDYPEYGVVSDCCYMVRKRRSVSVSLSQGAAKRKEYYDTVVDKFGKAVFDYAEYKRGYIPKFIQYTVMYAMNWIYCTPMKLLDEVLGEDFEVFNRKFTNLVTRIDDDIILMQKNIYSEEKIRLLERKYGDKAIFKEDSSKITVWHHENKLSDISMNKCMLEFMYVKDGNLYLEGWQSFVGTHENDEIRAYVCINYRDDILCELIDNRNIDVVRLGDCAIKKVAFKCVISDFDKYTALHIELKSRVNGVMVTRRRIDFGEYFPVANGFRYGYAMLGDWMASIDNNKYCINMQRVSYEEQKAREELYLTELSHIGSHGAREAIVLRQMYHKIKQGMEKSIWLISDRINVADDNGEALFRYVCNKKRSEDVFFVIDEDSSDFERLAQIGNVVGYLTRRHKLLYLLADAVINAYPTAYQQNPLYADRKYYKDLLYNKKVVFLQHGITIHDVSDLLGRYKHNFSLFITAANAEYESILRGNYFYDNSVVKLTGFARFDRLYDNGKKVITVMPTWRNYLGNDSQFQKTGVRIYDDTFKESQYYKFFNSLLNHSKLLETCEQYGYRIQFKPHPAIISAIGYFDHDSRVEFCEIDKKYNEVFAESSLVLTDYSSASIDFSYLRKPVIYAQFDKKEFYEKHDYKAGYFNYERDGFGEVVYDLESTVEAIIGYLKNNCNLKEEYRERIEKFFPFSDKNNCERIYEVIKDKVECCKQEKCKDKNVASFMQLKSNCLENYLATLEIKEKYPYKKREEICKEYFRYVFPDWMFKPDDKIIIYGAGEVGKSFYRLNRRYKFAKVMAVVDKKANELSSDGIPVQGIDAMENFKYDYILVAIRFSHIAVDAVNELMSMGVPRSKIVWEGTRYLIDDAFMNRVITQTSN